MRISQLDGKRVALWGWGREGRAAHRALRMRLPHLPLTLFCSVDEAGDADIAIRAGKSNDDSLVVRHVGNAALGVFAAPAYLARRGEPKTVEELADHETVLLRAQDGRAIWRLDGPNDEVSTVVWQ